MRTDSASLLAGLTGTWCCECRPLGVFTPLGSNMGQIDTELGSQTFHIARTAKASVVESDEHRGLVFRPVSVSALPEGDLVVVQLLFRIPDGCAWALELRSFGSASKPTFLSPRFWRGLARGVARYYRTRAQASDGLFITEIDPTGKADFAAPRWTVPASRHAVGQLFTFLITGDPDCLTSGRRGVLALLRQAVVRDRARLRFLTCIAADGSPLPDPEGLVNVFQHVYCAMAPAVGSWCGIRELTAVVHECHSALHAVFGDATDGGFFDAVGQDLSCTPQTRTKSFNSTVDVLSAFLQYAILACPNHPGILEDLRHIVGVVIDRMVLSGQPFVHEVFTQDYQPVHRRRDVPWVSPYNTEPGIHNAGSTAKVIWQSLAQHDRLTEDMQPRARAAAVALLEGLARSGAYDPLRGGFHDVLEPAAQSPHGWWPAYHSRSVWWGVTEAVQATMLAGLLRHTTAARQARNLVAFFLDRFVAEDGGIMNTVSLDGVPTDSGRGNPLHASYHVLEMALNAYHFTSVMQGESPEVFFSMDGPAAASPSALPIPGLCWRPRDCRQVADGIGRVVLDWEWKHGRPQIG